MTAVDLLPRLEEVFARHARPDVFTNRRHCSECAQHDDTLQRLHPHTMRADQVGHALWDPFSFATADAFLYLFPGLARLAAVGCGDDYYLDRFVSHVGTRIELFDRFELQLLLEFLWQLYDDFQDSPDVSEFDTHALDYCVRRLEAVLSPTGAPTTDG